MEHINFQPKINESQSIPSYHIQLKFAHVSMVVKAVAMMRYTVMLMWWRDINFDNVYVLLTEVNQVYRPINATIIQQEVTFYITGGIPDKCTI